VKLETFIEVHTFKGKAIPFILSQKDLPIAVNTVVSRTNTSKSVGKTVKFTLYKTMEVKTHKT
jgi:hypothetical protein